MRRFIPPTILAVLGVLLFVGGPAIAGQDEPVEVTPVPVTFVDPTCDQLEGYPVMPVDTDGYTYVQSDIVVDEDDVVKSSTWTAVAEVDANIVLVGVTSWSHTYPDAPTDCGDDAAVGDSVPPAADEPPGALPNAGA